MLIFLSRVSAYAIFMPMRVCAPFTLIRGRRAGYAGREDSSFAWRLREGGVIV